MSSVGRLHTKPKSAHFAYAAFDSALCAALRVLPPSSWTEHLALWWGYRFRPAPTVVKLRSGALIHVDPIDYLQLLIYYLGTFEPHCLAYLRTCAGKGSTIVDVGANIGLFTLEGSLAVGPTGRVIAIEAAPTNARALRKSVQLNSLLNVSVIETAVGDATGSATLTLADKGNLGMFTLGSVNGGEKHIVEVRTIDDLLDERRVDSVDLMKMDIEGSEFMALRGAERTLCRFRPTLLIELNQSALRRCGSSEGDVKNLLSGLGYRGWIVGRQATRPIGLTQDSHECDECLFIHRDNEPLVRKLQLSHIQCE